MPPRSTPTRAVLYLRQSTYREESISLEVQEATCRAYAQRQGYDVVSVESDPGISGRTWQRRGVQAVMDAIEHGRADVVVLWRWSRLSRSRKDWALAADRADLAGARIESATEPNDATAAGRFARGVMTELAAFESERIGEAWKEAHARRHAAGLPANGRPRFGYRYDLDLKMHVPDPVTAPVLADAYRRYVAGESMTSITATLNARRVPTNGGTYGGSGLWLEKTLRRILDAGFGAGFIMVQGQRRPGAHEAVIDTAIWTQYLEARQGRQRASQGGRREYALSGLVKCGICGERMNPTRAGNLTRLRCWRADQSNTHARRSTSYDPVLAAVREWVRERALEEEPTRLDVATPSRDWAREEARLSDQLLTATRQHLAGVIPEAAYLQVRDELAQQLEDVKAQRLADEAAATRPSRPMLARSLDADWENLPEAHRKEALRVLIDRVVVTPGGRAPDVTIVAVHV